MFIALGCIAGTLAGLLGIGGGILIVPGLCFIFTFMRFPAENAMHMAAATSLCIMICTTASSSWSYHKLGNITWPIFKKMLPGILFGVIIGTTAAHFLHSKWLSLAFGIYLLLAALKMLFKFAPKNENGKLPRKLILAPLSAIFGFISGLLGVGAGSTCVPYLLYCGIEMKKVAGTTGALTLPVAIIGTISVAALGSASISMPMTSGYIYWPAFLAMAPATVICAQVGAKLANHLPASLLKRIFAVLLLFLAAKMLWI